MIIAIDGPSGSGKSSTAKQVAKALNFVYLDTGAMYRAVSVGVLRSGIAPENPEEVAEAVRHMTVLFRKGKVLLNGRDVTTAIREDAANKAVTPVSANPAVRKLLVEKQRAYARDHDVVMEGRDIGTVVFPDAEYKFFLTAEIAVRAERRMKEAPDALSLEEVKDDLQRRDEYDASREHSPLKCAADAIVIDTTNMTLQQQTDKILSLIREPKNGGK
ncbi:MAG: (d)CMP kinase [Candidatus Marinimicrobia bacterium]|nr:(d)CMP kinase [Candidatus Neomarinimicrobiota bacterium]